MHSLDHRMSTYRTSFVYLFMIRQWDLEMKNLVDMQTDLNRAYRCRITAMVKVLRVQSDQKRGGGGGEGMNN